MSTPLTSGLSPAAPATASLEALSPQVAASLTAAIVSDSLDACGLRHQVMARDVVPVRPGLRAFGRAATVSFVPDDRDSEDPYAAAIAALDALTDGAVVVIATGGDDRTAYWGELFSAAATGRGAVGTVTDGPTRDTDKVAALGYPLFGLGTRPLDYRARMAVASVGEPVSCGGVEVAPGDIVLADEDGVVVIPRAHEAEVLARAVARASAEGSVLTELLAGARLREVWDRWRVL